MTQMLDKGWIDLIDSMPENANERVFDDSFYNLKTLVKAGLKPENYSLTYAEMAVVNAARVSTGTDSKGFEKDKKLLNYLYDKRHSSPFEQVQFKFRVKCPIFVARQWFRHRTMSANEISARYSEIVDEFYIPDAWRLQDTKNKQGSLDLPPGVYLDTKTTQDYVRFCHRAFELYQEMLDKGIAREMARMVLPTSTYTTFIYSVNLHNLMGFIRLRNKLDAQYEIRVYADWLAEFVKDCLPNIDKLEL